ncbi:MAG TPA: hypothetical protein VFI53_19110, partial [Myxococcaceae bacterium]|nr:hypothetical protein [Myxococcaceae bacterium]
MEEALHHQRRVAAGGQGEGDVQLGVAPVELVGLRSPENQLARLDQDGPLLVLEEQEPLGTGDAQLLQ